MSRWSEFFDLQVERQRSRRDPLARLPWWASLLLAVFVLLLGLVQIAMGSGASKLLGVALLVLVVPTQFVAALAAKRARTS
jgi:type VI protein secretion system component VasF